MKSKQAETIVTEYSQKLYGFALGRTASLQDAEDLAQEIALKLYKSLLVKDIDNINGYVWRVAHNTLANYYRDKSRKNLTVSINNLDYVLSSNDDTAEDMIEAETVKKLQNEIAYLSKIQRRIVIMYYYEGKKQADIAEILSIPVGTVKWHLFNARKELKKGMESMRNVEKLKFDPIEFSEVHFIGPMGTMGEMSNFFRSILPQNIIYSTYHQGKTINEISESLGVSPVYIESEVEFLEEYDFLIKKGEKYLSNVLIDEINEDDIEIVELHGKMHTKATRLISYELFDELMKSDLLDSDRIYYPDGDKNFLMWGLLLFLLEWSDEGLEEKIKFEEIATIRKDGGENVAYANVVNTSGIKPKYIDIINNNYALTWNGTVSEKENLLLWQLNTDWSNRIFSIYDYDEIFKKDIGLLYRFINEERLSVDEYAFMLQKGYIRKVDDKFELAIIWLKDNIIKEELVNLCNKIRRKHKEELEPLKEQYCEAVLEKTPKQVQKIRAYGLQNIFYGDGWFLVYTIKELLKCGKLKLPSEDQRLSLSTLIMPCN